MSFLLWTLGFYITYGLGMYGYAVLKAHEWTDIWDFSIRDGYIAGWIKYPKWTLFWLEGLVNLFKRK
uniref:Membrane protein n=1 Tax=Bacillus phage KoopaTroopa TaxID=3234046 RepID=A0AB39C6X8_9CAUD